MPPGRRAGRRRAPRRPAARRCVGERESTGARGDQRRPTDEQEQFSVASAKLGETPWLALPTPYARRHLPRLLALVHHRGADRARPARRRARPGLRLDLRGLGPGRGLAVRATSPRAPSGSRSAPALMQIPARQPTATAMAAATLDVLTGGRFRLGLGVSRAAGLRGLVRRRRSRARCRRTREYVEIVRRRWRARSSSTTGASTSCRCRGGPGQAAEAAGQAGAGADPDLPRARSGRSRSRRSARSPTAGCPSCSTRATRTRCSTPLREGLEQAGRSIAGHRRRPRGAHRRSTTTSPRRATPCGRGSPSTSGRWAPRTRTSTSSWPSAPASATPRGRSRTRWLARDRAGALAAAARRADRRMAIASTPGGLDDRLAAYEARRRRHARRRPVRPGPRRRSCDALGRRRERSRDRAGRPGHRGLRSPGPFPVGRYAAALQRPAARLRARAGLRRGGRLQARPGEGLLGAARRRPARCRARCGATTGTRSAAAARRRRAGRGRRRLRLLPGLAHLLAELLLRVAARARRRRGRPARPARRAAPAARGRGPVRAAEGAAATGAAALHRRRHRRGRQGARRRPRRACAAAAGPAARVGVRPGAGPPRRAARSPARCRTSPPARRSRSSSSRAAAARWRTCSPSATRRCAGPSSLLRVPVIASVGHHTDRTLIDDVAAVVLLDADPRRRGRGAGPLRRGARAAARARRPRWRPTAAAPCSSAPAGWRRSRARPPRTSSATAPRLHQQLREMRASARRRAALDAARARRRSPAPPSCAQGGRDRGAPRARGGRPRAAARWRSPPTTRSARSSAATRSSKTPTASPSRPPTARVALTA